MDKEKLPHHILRIGVAVAFLYPPYAALGDPVSWFSYFPGFIKMLPVPEAVLLHSFGLLEVVIALWILSGKRIFIPSALATALLLAIVVFNVSGFDVLFRDIAIAAMPLALAVGAYPEERAHWVSPKSV
jgi:hypothetical protein